MHQFELIFQFGSYLSQKIDGFCFNLAHFKGQKTCLWNLGPDHGQDFRTGYNLRTA